MRAGGQVEAAIAHVAQHVLDHAAAQLGRELPYVRFAMTVNGAAVDLSAYPIVAQPLPDGRACGWVAVASHAQRASRNHVVYTITPVDGAPPAVRPVRVDATVDLAPDVRILPGTILVGRTSVGPGSCIGPDCRLVDTYVGEGSTVSNTVATEAEIGDRVSVGPFAHLRPGTRLATDARVGAFVETKNADIAAGAKVPHLSYVGDAEVGEEANIGAGTITANYEGATKAKNVTKIGKGANTGSNSVLVAPVEVGDDAYVAAGAVVRRDVPYLVK